MNKVLSFLMVICVTAMTAHANDKAVPAALSTIDTAAIKGHFSLLGMDVTSIAPSPLPGLAQVMTDKGLFYMSDNGDYLLQGRLFNFKAGMVNETEKALSAVRVAGIQRFSDSMITYPAKDEKHVVTVFTDITCGYCRKLHKEMKQYNDLGITVRYLAFPRNGTAAPSFKDMESVWCAENPQQAMDDAKAQKPVTAASCANSVAGQYAFGQQIGITGTPAIILKDGTLQPGYVPADRLITLLNQG